MGFIFLARVVISLTISIIFYLKKLIIKKMLSKKLNFDNRLVSTDGY
jgi:hypothetical protein